MNDTALLAVVCGMLSGGALGLVGGGGSILATPLLFHVVRVGSPHVAIGTGAVAVAAAALFNFLCHAGAGHVRWRSAATFATIGVVGALIGSTMGKAVDGHKLLFLLGLLMIFVSVKTAGRRDDAAPFVDYGVRSDTAVCGLALAAGLASGFFGIGGGFLIVPCLLFATEMPMIDAVGSSLLAVAAFSIATAASYAHAGLIDWPIAGWFVSGGVFGGALGMLAASRLSTYKGLLRKIFAALTFAAAIYMIVRNLITILS